MSQILEVHPVDPQQRLLARAVDVLRAGGVIVYPTDSSYALGCRLGDKGALENIRRIRQAERDHEFTLVCRDLSEIATYARVDNWAYRLMKALTPGPFTFVLKATGEVPKRVQDKRKTIGIRVPDNRIAQALLESLGEALMSSTLLLPGEDYALADPDDIVSRVGKLVDAIVLGGACRLDPTTVIDLSAGELDVVRQGLGDVSGFAG